MKIYRMTAIIIIALNLSFPSSSAAQSSADEAEAKHHNQARTRAQYETMVQKAEKTRMEAMESAEEARELARVQTEASREAVEKKHEAQNREEQNRLKAQQLEEASRMREELSRTHRELREASREVARAHRELSVLEEQKLRIRQINLGDRAVIGVILGPDTPQGVSIIGVSPDGPAERAGLRQSDVLSSIDGVDLAENQGVSARDVIDEVMDEASAGDELDVSVIRDGQVHSFTVTAEQREPRSWQSMIRIQDVEEVPEIPESAQVVIRQIEVSDIDELALNAEISALQERVQEMEYVFITSDDENFEHHDGEWEFEFEDMSQMGEHALREANVWFGLPHARGFELTAINPGLGEYFETDRGVLVIKAKEDNAYNLMSGDVVLEIDSNPVDSPSDMMRALRELHSGNEVEIYIKRDRRNVSLKVTVPEHRFGFNIGAFGRE